MPSILVLHGPNMALRGLEALDDALQARADALALTVTALQSNGEAGLLDALLAEAGEADGVLVNPGVLAPSAWALAEALTLLGKPAVEVLLEAPPASRGPSALTGVVLAQVHGQGTQGYLAALEQLAARLGATPGAAPAEAADDEQESAPARRPARLRAVGKRPAVPAPAAAKSLKTLGRKASAPAATAAPPAGAKSLGRKALAAPAAAPPVAGLTRDQVRKRLSARLAGTLSAAELSTWARTEWGALTRGGPCEPGWRDRLDAVLLTLMGSAKAGDDLLLAQLARLEG